jgi:hypothetical protein
MTEVCVECGQTFPSSNERADHRRRTHASIGLMARRRETAPEVSESWACPLCDERLSSRAARLAHSLRPHYRSNRTIGRTTNYSVA